MDYSSKGAKASGIQNPCFRYAQKGLAYTLFGRGDSTGVATQRELFFMYSMAQTKTINVAAFAADFLGRVGRANSGGISVGGMITQIALHFGYQAILLEDTPIVGNTKIDMSALIAQGMIAVAPTYYSVLIHKRFIIALPDPDRVAITDGANWLYVSADPDADEGHDTDHFYAGDQFVDDQEEGREEEYPQAPPEHFVPQPQEPTQQAEGSSSWSTDQWGWIQTEIGDLRAEQQRQGIEQARQGAMLDDMSSMMRQLMLHFPHPPLR
jgi:hypothetical protein